MTDPIETIVANDNGMYILIYEDGRIAFLLAHPTLGEAGNSMMIFLPDFLCKTILDVRANSRQQGKGDECLVALAGPYFTAMCALNLVFMRSYVELTTQDAEPIESKLDKIKALADVISANIPE